jgi:hypothetical protein
VLRIVSEESAVADDVSVQCNENVGRDGCLPWRVCPLWLVRARASTVRPTVDRDGSAT